MALDGDRVVATASNSTLAVNNVGWVSGLGTIPAYRRRGIARAILLHPASAFTGDAACPAWHWVSMRTA